jgi:hypothetical protein
MSNDTDGLMVFNGIDGLTGDYSLPPMSPEHFAQSVLGQQQQADKDAGEYHETFLQGEHLALADDRDASDLADAGWGVIFATDEDPAVIEALRPLMAHRQKMAGDYYYEYLGEKIAGERRWPGHRPGESKEDFLDWRKAESFGPADPENAPYYLLIAGDPARIPFDFQYQLDQQYAVGRVHFRTPDEYAQYAANVIAAETAEGKLPRQALFFGPNHDSSTDLSARFLIEPLLEQLPKKLKVAWEMEPALNEQATKEKLDGVLNGDGAPTLLFTASHGVTIPPGQGLQQELQGALICQDHKYRAARKLRPDQYYFSAGDLASGTNLLGRVIFNFACFSAGTPQWNDFRLSPDLFESLDMSDPRWAVANQKQMAEQDFVARLPQKLLLNGVLATIGHIDRAWGASIYYSTKAARVGKHLTAYRSTMKRLMEGKPVGYAMEIFDERYGEMSAAITQELMNRDNFMPKKSDEEMIHLWTANQDARNYIIVGDPAVRLSLAGE